MTTAVVYALIDSRDGGPFYVGQTKQQAYQRLSGHIVAAQRYLQVGPLYDRLREILRLGARPEFVPLEVVDRRQVTDAEEFWIASLRLMGCTLTNQLLGRRGPRVFSKDALDRMAAANRARNTGRKLTAEHRGKIGRRGVLHPNFGKCGALASASVPILLSGVRYESLGAAAHAFGVSARTIRNWLVAGRAEYAEPSGDRAALHRNRQKNAARSMLGKSGDLCPTAKALVINGVRYPAVVAAARALGVDVRTIRKFMRRGQEALDKRFAEVIADAV